MEAGNQVINRLLRKSIKGPIFLLGCGQSGKTTLGTAISCHPKITFLDEARSFWIACYPETDIWSTKAIARGGKLILTGKDAHEAKSQRLRALFHSETVKTGKPILFHSLAINNFRLPFIYTIFPEARFIHIVRNAVEVAKSIEEHADRGKWFGHDSYKWYRLIDYAATKPDTAKLIPLCENNYDRGLIEWRLSIEAVYSFVPSIPKDAYLELSYDELIDTPVETVSDVLSFVGLSMSTELENSVRSMIHREVNKPSGSNLSDKDLVIVGALLKKVGYL